jgi:hypothetical protein
MNNGKRFWLALVLAGLLAGNAWADRGYGHHYPHSSVRLGIYLGDPWIYSPYYPLYPQRVIVTPAPIVVTPPAPPVYVEQQAAVPTLEPGYWYYCNESKAYYPHVQQCSGNWVKVAPQPAR